MHKSLPLRFVARMQGMRSAKYKPCSQYAAWLVTNYYDSQYIVMHPEPSLLYPTPSPAYDLASYFVFTKN